MSDYIIAVSKSGKSASGETDPNSFCFHSLYNTFKIISTGIHTIALPNGSNQVFNKPHHLAFTPLVTAFALETEYSQVFTPNSSNVYMYGWKTGIVSTGITFVSISADATNIIYKLSNSNASEKTIKIRYFCLETI